MKSAAKYLLLVLLLSACYKDEVVLEDLTTNMFDPDYTGPAFIDIVSVGLQQVQAGVWNQVVQVHVKSELFPNPRTYHLFVECLNDTSTEDMVQQPEGSDDFIYIKSNVELDSTYCYEFSLRVEYSNTRADEHCFIAQ